MTPKKVLVFITGITVLIFSGLVIQLIPVYITLMAVLVIGLIHSVIIMRKGLSWIELIGVIIMSIIGVAFISVILFAVNWVYEKLKKS